MEFMKNAIPPEEEKKPETQETKQDETTKENKADVEVEYDPTVPDNEKKEIAQQKANAEEKKEAPAKEEEKTVIVKLTDLQLFTRSVMALAKNTADLKKLMANQRADIELLKNSYDQIREDAQSMAKSVEKMEQLKPLLEDTNLKVANMKIKWDLTYKPIQNSEITDAMQSTAFKQEYTDLNNILDQINKLKKKIEKNMCDMMGKEGYQRTKEYRDLYMLGMRVSRLFNVWPQKMRYFASKEPNQVELEMSEAQAELLDVTEKAEEKEKEDLWASVGI